MIPVYLNARDLLTPLRTMVERLAPLPLAGPITIVDNGSTYPPLLQWYDEIEHGEWWPDHGELRVVRLDENLGERAPFRLLKEEGFEGEYAAISDPDLDLSDVPDDFLEVLLDGLRRYPDRKKAGLSLRVDDLPHDGPLTAEVRDHEARFWKDRLDDRWYHANVGLTFAVYRKPRFGYKNSIRAAPPYAARHIPWYLKPEALNGEWRYYFEHALCPSACWSGLMRRLLAPSNSNRPRRVRLTEDGSTLPRQRYVTTGELVSDTISLASRLPADIDAIVGVPRSGMLVASHLATLLHVPLWASAASPLHEPSPLVYVGHGWRLETTVVQKGEMPTPRAVLVVDDTAHSGTTMGKLRPHVAAQWPEATVLTAVVYAHPRAKEHLDYVGAFYPGRHYLEWNLFNSGFVHNLVTDFDGVLCGECPVEADDDGPAYREWLESVGPIQRPRFGPLRAIVTARLEKYRDATEAWLARYGIQYRELHMGPWASQAERNENWPDKVASFKAAVYQQTVGARMFVESDPAQARMIRELSGQPVLCPALRQVL